MAAAQIAMEIRVKPCRRKRQTVHREPAPCL